MMPSLPADKLSWDRLDRLHDELRSGRSSIVKFLVDHCKDEIGDSRWSLIAMMCDILYEAAKGFHDIDSSQDFGFYFWPNYNLIFPSSANEPRMQLWSHLLDSKDKIFHGISPAYPIDAYSSSNNNIWGQFQRVFAHRAQDLADKVKALPSDVRPLGLFAPTHYEKRSFRLTGTCASLWFSKLLTRSHSFEPGSTHLWLANQRLRTKNDRLLSCLAIGLGSKSKVNGSVCTVGFQSSGISTSAGLISQGVELSFIDTFNTDDGNLIHPLLWPCHDSNGKEPGEIWRVRCNLYSLWFRAVFRPKEFLQYARRIEPPGDAYWAEFLTKEPMSPMDFPKSNTGSPFTRQSPVPDYLQETISRIREAWHWMRNASSEHPGLLEAITEKSSYRYWYSLVVDSAPSLKPTDDSKEIDDSMGSAMIFSAKSLKYYFLATARSWIQEIFLLFRSHENELVSRKQGELAGRVIEKEAAFTAASHELKKLACVIPLADGKPHILENLPSVFLMFSLPTAGKLNVNDARYLPDKLHANSLATYRDWLNSLIKLAASIEAISQPMKSGVMLDENKYRSACEMFAHKFQICGDALDKPSPPDFAVRCLFGTGVVCLLRNVLQHGFFDYDNIAQDSPWSEKYEEKAIVTLTERLICITNPTSSKTLSGNGGTNAAAIYYLSQIPEIGGWDINLNAFTNASEGDRFVCRVPLPFNQS